VSFLHLDIFKSRSFGLSCVWLCECGWIRARMRGCLRTLFTYGCMFLYGFVHASERRSVRTYLHCLIKKCFVFRRLEERCCENCRFASVCDNRNSLAFSPFRSQGLACRDSGGSMLETGSAPTQLRRGLSVPLDGARADCWPCDQWFTRKPRRMRVHENSLLPVPFPV